MLSSPTLQEIIDVSARYYSLITRLTAITVTESEATPMVYCGLKWSKPVRVAPEIVLTEEQTAELIKLSRSGRSSVRLAQRARIVLLASLGWGNKDIAQEVGVGRVAVVRWRQRYLESGIEGIERGLPCGAPPIKVDVAKLVALTAQSKPVAATNWSSRKMADELGFSASTVCVIGRLMA